MSFAASVADLRAGEVVVKRRVRVKGRALRGIVRRNDIFVGRVSFLSYNVNFMV